MMTFFALFLLISIVSATTRFIRSGDNGLTGNNKVCYVISAEHQTRPSGASGNVFAAAQGITIGGFPAPFPWTALGYVKGSVDLDSYTGTALDKVHIDADGAVVAWSYVAVGEFCDVDGQEGYQSGTSDYIIGYYTAPQALLYSNTCGSEADPITGDNSYYSTIKTSQADIFQVSCRVFPTATSGQRNGRTVGPLTYKCDVTLDYSTLWSTNNTAINGCADSNRKVGMLINVAGSAFDLDVTVDNLNVAGVNTPDGDKITFNSGRLTFAWDNYYKRVSAFNATTGANGRVVANYFKAVTDDSSVRLFGASAINQIIFSFDAPKSANQDLYYWDPSTTMSDSSSSAITATFGMIFFIFVAMFLSE